MTACCRPIERLATSTCYNANVYQITLEIQKLEEGPYLGTSPELPGLIVQGKSPEEVVELAPDIARELIEVMLETGEAPS